MKTNKMVAVCLIALPALSKNDVETNERKLEVRVCGSVFLTLLLCGFIWTLMFRSPPSKTMWIHYAVSRVIHYTAERLVSLSSSLSGRWGESGSVAGPFRHPDLHHLFQKTSPCKCSMAARWWLLPPPTHARHHYQCPKYSKVSVQRIRNSCYSRDLFHFSHLAHSACLFVLLCYRRMIRRYRLYTFLWFLQTHVQATCDKLHR